LSGGQRQRVAIGRAIVKQPKAFLFDEPLSNLDAGLRGRTRIELARLHQRMSATMVFVTHDQVEAMTMATRIVVMNQGRIEQVGTPMEAYQQPGTRFVAGFVGTPAMNFLPVARVAEREGFAVACLPDGTEIVTQVPAGRLPSGDLTLGIRAENIVPSGAENLVPGRAESIMPEGGTEARVVVIERLGERTLIYADLRDSSTVVYDEPGDVRLSIGERVRLTFDGTAAHLFGPDGMAIRG
jgi:multiple sugar transport system ATP-binding protein